MGRDFSHACRRWDDLAALALRQARLRAGLSQSEAARLVQCGTGTVSRLEGARGAPSTVLAGQLLDAYGVTDDAVRQLVLSQAKPDAGRSRWSRAEG